jgi:hypothetical protein
MRAMLVQKRPRLRVLWSACNRLLGGQAAYKVARHATRNENFVKSGDASGILRGSRGGTLRSSQLKVFGYPAGSALMI